MRNWRRPDMYLLVLLLPGVVEDSEEDGGGASDMGDGLTGSAFRVKRSG